MRNVEDMTTEELKAIIQEDTRNLDGGLSWEELEPILAELGHRRKQSNPNAKTATEAYREFLEHYISQDDLL